MPKLARYRMYDAKQTSARREASCPPNGKAPGMLEREGHTETGVSVIAGEARVWGAPGLLPLGLDGDGEMGTPWCNGGMVGVGIGVDMSGLGC